MYTCAHAVVYEHNTVFAPHPLTYISLIAGQLSEVHCVFTDLEEEPEGIREEFTKLLFGLFCHHRDRQDQEEMRIVGNT